MIKRLLTRAVPQASGDRQQQPWIGLPHTPARSAVSSWRAATQRSRWQIPLPRCGSHGQRSRCHRASGASRASGLEPLTAARVEGTGTMRMRKRRQPFRPWLPKKAERGFHGHPIATIAFYGPTDKLAMIRPSASRSWPSSRPTRSAPP